MIADSPPASDARKVLELELMHRWSTSTYLAICAMPEDRHLMQTLLPREGLKHAFVLQGIFAVTALDLAVNASMDRLESKTYMHAAMEYYDTASVLLRNKLAESPPEEYWLVFLVSYMAAVYHCAVPQIAQSIDHTALGHITVLFSLLNGATTVSLAHSMALLDSPITSLRSMRLPDQSLLDTESLIVLNRLRAINDAVYPSGDPMEVRPNPPLGPLVDPEPRTQHEVYRRAIHHLGSCFVEDARGVLQSYCSSYPGWNGNAFAKAVAAHEPVALVILMHWGVLLDRLGKQMWWASSIGFTLVAELSELLQHTNIIVLPDVRDAIAWVRHQIGLQDMVPGG